MVVGILLIAVVTSYVLNFVLYNKIKDSKADFSSLIQYIDRNNEYVERAIDQLSAAVTDLALNAKPKPRRTTTAKPVAKKAPAKKTTNKK